MAKPPPGESGKKNVARRDEGPTHQMAIHPEFGEDGVEDATDMAQVPDELLPKKPVATLDPADRTGPETELAKVSGDDPPDDRPGFDGNTRVEPTRSPAPSEPKPTAAAREDQAFKDSTLIDPAPSRPEPKAQPRDSKESKEAKDRGGFTSDTRVESSPPPRESKERKAPPRETKEPKGGFSSDTRVEPPPSSRPEPKEAKEPKGFSSDTRVEPAPASRPEPKGFSSDTHVEPAPATRSEPKEAKEPKDSKSKGFFERTDPAAKPEPPAVQTSEMLPWESGESPSGAPSPPRPKIESKPAREAQPAKPSSEEDWDTSPSVPSEEWPDEPVLTEPPKRSAAHEGMRRASSPGSGDVAEEALKDALKKSPKPTRDAVPITVANQETNVRAAPTSRDVAGQETRIKAAPTADERSNRSVANQDTNIRAAPEEPERRRTAGQQAVRGDFPEAAAPRRGSNVANASTLLKPIPEDVQKDLGVEKPSRRSGSRDAARKPAPIEQPDPTPAHGVQTDPEPESEPEPEEPPRKPKPLPFVDKRPRHGSSADLLEASAQDGDQSRGLRGAKRADQRGSKVFQTLSHLKTMSEGNPKGLLIVGGAFALIVVVVIAVGILRGGDKPREDELRRAYPFGYGGARGPRGEQAPGAAELKYSFLMMAPCPQTAEPDCMLYEYQKGAFSGRMLLRKTSDGWVRASDEGAPFLIAK
ncbi:MAG: hypothetical protein QM765_44830 [Myxococcales bacterium]